MPLEVHSATETQCTNNMNAVSRSEVREKIKVADGHTDRRTDLNK